jgi:hypothetical protein
LVVDKNAKHFYGVLASLGDVRIVRVKGDLVIVEAIARHGGG